MMVVLLTSHVGFCTINLSHINFLEYFPAKKGALEGS
jgi:hypothetical protein